MPKLHPSRRSILAKTHRDTSCSTQPNLSRYGWETNMGYPHGGHRQALGNGSTPCTAKHSRGPTGPDVFEPSDYGNESRKALKCWIWWGMRTFNVQSFNPKHAFFPSCSRCSLRPPTWAQCENLFSEAAEGSSNNKYLEIYNPTFRCAERLCFPTCNAPSLWANMNFGMRSEGAMVAAGDVYVLPIPV